jgi:hypothetical protein
MDLIEALQRLGGKFPATAILGELGAPVAALASEVIDFSFADEEEWFKPDSQSQFLHS